MTHRLILLLLVCMIIAAEDPEVSTTLSDGSTLEARAWIPDGPVRALLIGCHGLNGDFRSFPTRKAWQSWASEQHVALVGLHFANRSPNRTADGPSAALSLLPKLAKQTGHQELAQVPLLAYGHSAGGGFAVAVAGFAPQRILAWVHVKGQSISETVGSLGSKATGNPGLLILGSDDKPERITAIRTAFTNLRQAGHLVCLAADHGHGHSEGGSEILGRQWFTSVLAIRLRGPNPQPVPPSAGLLGELPETWTKPRTIKAAGIDNNQARRCSWLPDQEFSELWAKAWMKQP